MDTLTVEILDLIVSQCNASSLCSLRLACRSLEIVAARRLWASITVKPDREVMKRFYGVLKSPKLSKYVRKVSFNTGIEGSLNGLDDSRDALNISINSQTWKVSMYASAIVRTLVYHHLLAAFGWGIS
jgi:hypothetical protein